MAIPGSLDICCYYGIKCLKFLSFAAYTFNAAYSYAWPVTGSLCRPLA
jgi:hypothetical protein